METLEQRLHELDCKVSNLLSVTFSM
jgi:hypothetical protein